MTDESILKNVLDTSRLSVAAREKLASLEIQINCNVVIRMLWDRLLSEESRQQLGESYDVAWRENGLSGMLAALSGKSHAHSMVEVAYQAELLTSQAHHWLMCELDGLPVLPQRAPSWNRDTLELMVGNEVVKRFRSRTIAKNVVCILDAFEHQGWRRHIADPLPGLPNPERLHQAIRDLNKKIPAVKFRVTAAAKGITWEFCDLTVIV